MTLCSRRHHLKLTLSKLVIGTSARFNKALTMVMLTKGELMKLGTMRIFRPLTLVAACTVLGVIGFTMGNNKLARTKLDKPLSIQRSDEKVIEELVASFILHKTL